MKLRTIILGSCVSVQGLFIKNLTDGKIAISVDGKVFEGMPI